MAQSRLLGVNPQYDDITSDEFTNIESSEWTKGVWALSKQQLAKLFKYDNSFLGKQPAAPFPAVARLYVTYNEIIKRLDWVWKNTLQAQKSIAMRRFLDAAMTRLAEFRDMLTELDISEYHYIDNELIELKLIPRDIELIPLSAYPIERDTQLQELANRLFQGERIYFPPIDYYEDEEYEGEEEEDFVPVMQVKHKRPVVEVVTDPVYEKMKENIFVIQKHERARVERLEFCDQKVVYTLKRVYKPPDKRPIEFLDAAATVIQSAWRGYLVRRDMKKRFYRGRLLLNIDVPSYRPTSYQQQVKALLDAKKKYRLEKVQEYIDTIEKERERVFRVVAPGLLEDITDEIRWWFRNWYDVALAFDKYPTEEQGGTIIVVRGETMTPEEYRIEQEKKRLEKQKLKNNPGLAKKMKEEAAKKKKAEQEAKKKEKARLKQEKALAKKLAKAGIVEPFTFKEGKALEQMNEAEEIYARDWTELDEEIAGPEDKLVVDRITVEKCMDVQLEMRRIADEMMRVELELLEKAHAQDRKKKYKKPKNKRKKGKKKKEKKDITANRTTEDLFQELYDNGIIRPYPETNLESYIGDYGYASRELRAIDRDPFPCVGEPKQLVVSNCILPLGGENVSKPKSVLIFGPKQSGKKLLVHAICTATQAVMFDLSPTATAGKYPGKAGINMLVHLVNKMSRLLQPSVLFVDGAEKIFYKKVPKIERILEPKKLKGKLFKQIVKTIKPEDRVMLIGTSNQPFAAARQLVQCYEKYIFIPRTDYGTCYQLWMDLLMNYHGVQRDIDVSALAKLSAGYSIPYIRETAERVLCPRRIIRLKYEPLRVHEILEGLMTGPEPDPVSDKEYNKLLNWYGKKTKIGKMRRKVVGLALQKRLDEEAAAAAAANKKKK